MSLIDNDNDNFEDEINDNDPSFNLEIEDEFGEVSSDTSRYLFSEDQDYDCMHSSGNRGAKINPLHPFNLYSKKSENDCNPFQQTMVSKKVKNKNKKLTPIVVQPAISTVAQVVNPTSVQETTGSTAESIIVNKHRHRKNKGKKSKTKTVEPRVENTEACTTKPVSLSEIISSEIVAKARQAEIKIANQEEDEEEASYDLTALVGRKRSPVKPASSMPDPISCKRCTRVCKKIAAGETCHFGNRCKFAHIHSDLVVSECRHRSRCYNKQACAYWHSESETKTEFYNRVGLPKINKAVKGAYTDDAGWTTSYVRK